MAAFKPSAKRIGFLRKSRRTRLFLAAAVVQFFLLPLWFHASLSAVDHPSTLISPNHVDFGEDPWARQALEALEQDQPLKLPNEFPATRRFTRESSVTMTVQTGTSNFLRLLFMIQRWGGPVSASIRLVSLEDIQNFRTFRRENTNRLENTTIHLFIESGEKEYPHNILREMALQHIETDFFLALDVDFVTPVNCHEQLSSLIADHPELDAALRDKTLMVLPAFNHEVRLDDHELRNDVLPSRKDEFIQLVKQGTATEFHVAKYFPGHGPTNFPRWYETENEICYPITYMAGFEPYVLGYRDNVPHYWEGFRGHGYNKVSWFIEAHAKGYSFAVLRDFFVVHLDHEYHHHGITSRSMEQAQLFRSYLIEKYHADPKELYQITRWRFVIWFTKFLELFYR